MRPGYREWYLVRKNQGIGFHIDLLKSIQAYLWGLKMYIDSSNKDKAQQF